MSEQRKERDLAIDEAAADVEMVKADRLYAELALGIDVEDVKERMRRVIREIDAEIEAES